MKFNAQRKSMSPQISPKAMHSIQHQFSNQDFLHQFKKNRISSSKAFPAKTTLDSAQISQQLDKLKTCESVMDEKMTSSQKVPTKLPSTSQQYIIFAQYLQDVRFNWLIYNRKPQRQPEHFAKQLKRVVSPRSESQSLKGYEIVKQHSSIPELFKKHSEKLTHSPSDASISPCVSQGVEKQLELTQKELQHLEQQLNKQGHHYLKILLGKCKQLQSIAKNIKIDMDPSTRSSENDRNQDLSIKCQILQQQLEQERRGRLKLEEQASQMIQFQEKEIQNLIKESKVKCLETEILLMRGSSSVRDIQ